MLLPYYRRNFFVLWIATFMASSAWQQVVPFLPLFLQQLGVTDNLNQWSSAVFALHYISAIFFLPFWGKVADKYGQKPLMLRAGICLGSLYWLMSLATNPYQVAAVRFLNGALTGFIPCAVSLCAINTPKKLTSRYVASLQTASAAGTIIGPSIGGILADYFDFRGALRASSIMVFMAVVLVLVLVEEKNKTRVESDTSLLQDVRTSIKHPVLFGTMLAICFTAVATLSLQPILTLYLSGLHQGGANWLRGAVFSLPGISFLVTAGMWVRLGEKRGLETLIPLGLVFSGFAIIGLSFARSVIGFSVVYLIMGIFVASLRPSAAALVALKVDTDFQGRAYAMQQGAFMFGGFVGPLTFGTIAKYTGTCAMFSWLGVFLIISAVYMHNLIQRWSKLAPSQSITKTAV